MTKLFFKNIRKSITGSLGRYIAILCIILLGVAFFSGLKLTRPIMIRTGQDYLDETLFYDFKLMSNLGVDDCDIDAVSDIDGVTTAVGSISHDFLWSNDDEEHVISAASITEGINIPYLVDGRLPEKANECVADSTRFTSDDIGKVITLADTNSEDTFEQFAYDEYEIVGIVNTPLYLQTDRGTTSIGNGSVWAFVLIPEDGFDFEYYTEMYVRCENDYDIYSDEYEDFTDNLADKIEPSFETSVNDRYESMINDALSEINEAQDELDEKAEEYQAQLDEAKSMLDQLEALYSSGMSDVQIQAIASSMGLTTTYEEAKAEYDANKQELDEEIEKAQKEIDDAKAEIDDIDEPAVYVLSRDDSSQGYSGYETDSMIVENISNVFPVFFLLIAALVCSTTMTRMIDDERTQIGTLRALGYSRKAIQIKYLLYSASASIFGCLIGYFAGGYVFPLVIMKAYQMLYIIPGCDIAYSPILLVITLAASIFCSAGVTFLACRHEMQSPPADLIRPKTPAAGKRILLERFTPFWNRLNFLYKFSLRNIFRFKKRMIMMIIGIAGCTTLVVAGFGIKDSVAKICDYQYGEITKYDILATAKDTITDEWLEDIQDEYSGKIASRSSVLLTAGDIEGDSGKKSAYIMATDDAGFSDVIDLHYNGESVGLSECGGVLLSEKLASLVGAKIGDNIEISISDTEKETVRVDGIVENYVYNYIYMTGNTYKELFGSFEPKSLMLCLNDGVDEYSISASLSSRDDIVSVQVTTDMKKMVDNMMQSLDYVVMLIIASAAALAFIVLFNLGNINISERVREIATIKVLGFHSSETGAYVFRENLILTLIGILVGLPLGKLFHMFVMSQIKVDMVTFKSIIRPQSFLFTFVLVLLFSIISDLILRRKIARISMTESLKSVE